MLREKLVKEQKLTKIRKAEYHIRMLEKVLDELELLNDHEEDIMMIQRSLHSEKE